MRFLFKFPDIGEGLDEGTILEWHVFKGQPVKVGESLLTMETDKVVTSIPSPRTGIIAEIYGKVGQTIRVGTVLVELELPDSSNQNTNIPTDTPSYNSGVVGTLEVASGNVILSPSSEGIENDEVMQPIARKILATPVARAMAKDLGIDIYSLQGSGPAGRITKEDIIRADEQKHLEINKSFAAKSNTYSLVEVEPMTHIRKIIAKNMVKSKQTAAHMTMFDEVEVSELIAIKKQFEEEYMSQSVKLKYLPFIVKAVALSLRKHRQMNAEIDEEHIIYKHFYNISIAIDTPKGLVVPVIKEADRLSIKELAIAIQVLSEKAINGVLSLEEMREGTFTITSYGGVGGKFAVPIINYPQVAILGIGRIYKEAIVRDDHIVIGNMLPLSLSVDHRITDGVESVKFIQTIMRYLSNPISLFME